MTDSATDWESIGYILASDYRRRIFFYLEGRFLTPTEIASATGFNAGHVSDILVGLRERDLVECRNPKARKGRLYTHTEKGSSIMASLKKIKVKT